MDNLRTTTKAASSLKAGDRIQTPDGLATVRGLKTRTVKIPARYVTQVLIDVDNYSDAGAFGHGQGIITAIDEQPITCFTSPTKWDNVKDWFYSMFTKRTVTLEHVEPKHLKAEA